MSLFSSFSLAVVVAPVVGIGFWVIVLAIACRIAVAGGILWVEPIMDWLTKRGPGWLGGLIRWVTRPLERRVQEFLLNYYNNLMRAHYSTIEPALRLLGQSTVVTQRLAGTLGDMAEQTWRALWVLNHETIPRKIAAATLPLRTQLRRHTERLDDVEALNRGVAVVVGTGLRSLPWGAPGSYVGNFDSWWDTYRHLWTQFFGIAQPRIAELWSERVESLRDRFNELETRVTLIREEALPAIRQRIGRAETRLDEITSNPLAWIIGALGTVAGVAALTVLLRRIAPNLFCRNVTDVTGRVCAQDDDLWASLLAGTMIFALALNPREIARAGTALTGVLGGVIAETVDH